jgi:hypothetical protein
MHFSAVNKNLKNEASPFSLDYLGSDQPCLSFKNKVFIYLSIYQLRHFYPTFDNGHLSAKFLRAVRKDEVINI